MPQPQVCANHPQRPALALCMACGQRFCQECVTPWEGIHYCAPCLGKRRAGGRERRRILGWLPMLLAAALLFVLANELRVLVAANFGELF